MSAKGLRLSRKKNELAYILSDFGDQNLLQFCQIWLQFDKRDILA